MVIWRRENIHQHVNGTAPKNSIIDKIKDFYTNGFNDAGLIISPEYKDKVLSLNKSILYASLKWLQEMDAIDENDMSKFEHIKKCRNTLTHEMLTFASSGVDFDIPAAFQEMIDLLRKIELWWFVNLEMDINSEAYPDDLNIDDVTPGPVWSLQMLIDVALGPEDVARKYYDHFMSNA